MNLPGRILTLGLGLVVLASLENAEGAPKRKRAVANANKQATNDSDSELLTAPLIAPSILSKLRITPSQRPQVGMIFKEFDAKLKEEAAKVRKFRAEAAANPPPKGKKIKGGKGQKGMKGRKKGPKNGNNGSELQEILNLREEYEEKFVNVLTDSQKKTWEDIKVKQGEALLSGGK